MRGLLILLLQFHLLLAAVISSAQEPGENGGIGQVDAGEDVDVGLWHHCRVRRLAR